MNILFWILQAVLALHTAMGAKWKFSRTPEQTMPSLKVIPQGVWIAMAVFELGCAIGLVIPAVVRSLGVLAPVAALCIVAEMLLFCVMHLFSGAKKRGPMIYWLVVAAVCAFVAYGRFVLSPL